MRVRQFQKSCVLTFGLLAALAMDCDVSLGQADSNRRSTGTGLIETAAFIDLPQTFLQEESSPSDSAKSSEDEKEPKKLEEQKKEEQTKKDSKDSNPSKNARDAITPMQNRELTIRVQAVSISNEKVGTGLVPESGSPRSADQAILVTGISRGMQYTHVTWRASNIQHMPLYFEDAMLERHGHTRCFHGYECAQSFISGAKFFGTIPLLPYLETLRPKHDCVYALGHYRPGSAAPCLRDNIPYDAKAAIVESASAAAFFWAMPL